ncbi:MAG: hypothetical protein ACI4HQ_09620 [Acetatifactor sp.]
MNKDEKLVRDPLAVQRKYKDTLFRMIFQEPEKLLELYNAVNGTDYQNPEELQIVTLENAIYMNMKNDLACIIDCRMNLYEHQSSVNANMPLRNLFYVAMEYHELVSQKSLYSSRLVKLPTPYFVVFYNGKTIQPECREMKLSDAFLTPVKDPALELKVVQLNIRAGHNRELMDKCPILAQYAEYVGRVQQYAEGMSLEAAVKRAVNECIKEGILADFLQKHKAEAIEVSIFEYDEEKELRLFGEAERENGREEGLEEGQLKKLVEQICRKLRKGKSAEVIAEELEEDLENILPICESTSVYAPDYDSNKVYEKVKDLLGI